MSLCVVDRFVWKELCVKLVTYHETLASFWMSSCCVVSDKRSKTVTYLWQEKSHPAETRFNQKSCGKNNKISLPSGLRQMQKRRKPLIQIKFQVFYSSSTLSLVHSKVTWRCNFLSLFCGPFKAWCGPLGGNMAHAENHRISIAVLTTDSIAYKIFIRHRWCAQGQETRTA